MANYAANNEMGGTQQNLSATYKTILGWVAASGTALRRAKLYDILIGANGTPADNELEWDFPRQTAAGTATSITPVPLDPADAAALGTPFANATAEGTVTANTSQLYVAINQRASYRWVAAPGSEIVIPATNLAGIVGRARSSAYGATVTMAWLVQEQ